MLAEIELFVKENYNPHVIDLFYRGFEAFEALYEDVDYNEPYMTIMMDDSFSGSDTSDRLRARLGLDIFNLISQFEVKINPDTNTFVAISILEGLIELPHYEDKDTIVRTIESGDSSVEIFADLLELVTVLKENEVMQVIEYVPTELLTKLMENIDPQHDSQGDPEDTVDTALLRKLKAYKDYTSNQDNVGFKLVREGFAIGVEFKQYQQAIGVMLDTVEDIDTVTDELLTLLYLSSDAYLNPLQFYTDNSSTIFADEKRITQVYVKIKNRIAQFEAHYTNLLVKAKGIANAQA